MKQKEGIAKEVGEVEQDYDIFMEDYKTVQDELNEKHQVLLKVIINEK